MQNYIKLSLKSSDSIFHSLHIWIILTMILVISIFYYYVIEANWFTVFHTFPFIREFIIREWVYKINGILYYFPLIYAAVVFGWRGTLIIWLISMIVILAHLISYTPNNLALFNNVILLSIPLLVVAYINVERRWRNKERILSAEREVERQKYLAQIFKVQEDERTYIAQEIHDDSLQQLAMITSKLQDMLHDENLNSVPSLKEKAESIKDMTVSLSGDLRKLSLRLRPKILDDLGLLSALRWQVEHFQQESGINATISIKGDPQPISDKISVHIFRIVQEALNNIKRHAQATYVNVIVEFTGKILKVTVQDNGKGLPANLEISELTNKGKLGIIGMNQRAQFINGIILFQSEPEKGTAVSVEVDLRN
jgi:two-component system, NarL family, sensor histidine kinase DegS